MTENEDACRDLSGRRLRLVNADKKLKDWAAAEKQRKDEKQAAKEEREKAKAEIRAEDAQVCFRMKEREGGKASIIYQYVCTRWKRSIRCLYKVWQITRDMGYLHLDV